MSDILGYRKAQTRLFETYGQVEVTNGTPTVDLEGEAIVDNGTTATRVTSYRPASLERPKNVGKDDVTDQVLSLSSVIPLPVSCNQLPEGHHR